MIQRKRFWDFSLKEEIEYPFNEHPSVRRENGFRLIFSQVDSTKIESGGPGRDGIPAILNPKFVSQVEADAYMASDDIVLSMAYEGATKAYPFRIMNWHEIVNDSIGDVHFAATYCPLCGSALAFNRMINGRLMTFGVSGLLFQDNVLMYDHQTESLWNQLALQAQTGPMFKTGLEWIPTAQMRYASWKEKFPNGVVLSTDTGFSRNYNSDPYAGYFSSDSPFFYDKRLVRPDLPIKSWVYGVVIDDVARTYPLQAVEDNPTITDTVNSVTLSIVYDSEAELLKAVRLDPNEELPAVRSFWFAWQAFHPETTVYGQ